MENTQATRPVSSEQHAAVSTMNSDLAARLDPLTTAIFNRIADGALSIDELVRLFANEFNTTEEHVKLATAMFLEGPLKGDEVVRNAPTPDCSCDLVWVKGIAARCDWRIPDEFPEGLGYRSCPPPAGFKIPGFFRNDLIENPQTYCSIKEGDIVWVNLAWIRSFIKDVLPCIKTDFILVTGDCDFSPPSSIMAEALQLLECPRLIHWYAQNCDAPGFMDRMSPLPIGLDFHTLSQKTYWREKNISTPVQQEQLLRSVRAQLPPTRERIRKVYIDFAWQPSYLYPPERRRDILKRLLWNKAVAFQSKPLPRTELWRRWGEYAFVLSPHGFGLDCHRTWEALACGHIVLVPSSPLDSLYEGLPVIPISDWNAITDRNLDMWLEKYSGCDINAEKLTSAYWINRMRQGV